MLVVHGIANDRTSHTVTATTAATEFRADNRNHLDAFLAKQRVGVGVAIVSIDDTRRCANEICAAVPLSPLPLIVTATSFDHPQLLEAQCFLDDADK